MTAKLSGQSAASNKKSFELPLRLFTALRTVRLYPPTNPQVQRSTDLLILSCQSLKDLETQEVTLVRSDLGVMVNGETLPEKDQIRPQVSGIAELLGKLNLHSLTFHNDLSSEECSRFIQVLSDFENNDQPEETLQDLLKKNDILNVTLDEMRYVAVREGEKVVHESEVGVGLAISDEELANFVLGRGMAGLEGQTISPDIINELLTKLPDGSDALPIGEGITGAMVEALQQLTSETEIGKRNLSVSAAASNLSSLDPVNLSKLLALLPDTPVTDDMLQATVEQLGSGGVNTLITNLIGQLSGNIDFSGPHQSPNSNLLKKLATSAYDPSIKRTIAQNVDASKLLHLGEQPVEDLPENLIQRLQQPEWSAPVLANAVHQSIGSGSQQGRGVELSSFNQMLDRYESLLSQEKQLQVVEMAGKQLASMEGLALGQMLSQKFKGALGEQLYAQLLDNVSDEQLEDTVEQLNPQQLGQMVNSLTYQVPSQEDNSPEESSLAAEELLQRLMASSKGNEVQQAYAYSRDAQNLLQNPDTTIAELPEDLRKRLQEPQWSAPVLANIVEQSLTGGASGEPVDMESINKILPHYEQLLTKEKQLQVAEMAGEKLASVEGLALGNILANRFKGLLGEKLYNQILYKLTDDQLDESIDQLNPKQLNRLVTSLTSNVPLYIDKDGQAEFVPADDSVLKRLVGTGKGEEIQQVIKQNVDARQLLEASPVSTDQLPEQLRQRLQQPDWSAPVLAKIVEHSVDQAQQEGGPIDIEAINKILPHYEQLLTREKQLHIAEMAGEKLASVEGLALGNILANKFKGLLGEKLYNQILYQLTDEQLDESIDQLNPKQLNRLVTSLTSNVPLYIDKDGQAEFVPTDDSVLKRLVGTGKGEEIQQFIKQNVDARQLLEASPASTDQLPEQLRKRLQQPDWSAPVLANIVEHSVEHSQQEGGPIDMEVINRILPHYEKLLTKEKQLQVAELAGEKLASVEGLALGNILANRFKGLLGEKLYNQILYQLTDEQLDESIDQLNPKQLNRLVTSLTSNVPLYIDKDGQAEFVPADDSVLKRLVSTGKGEEIQQVIKQNVDARQLLEASPASTDQLPEQLRQRLQQPDWSAPVLANIVEQSLDQGQQEGGSIDMETINKILPHYEQLLSKEKQLQVAELAGEKLASVEGLALGNILANRFKGLLGEKLYNQILYQLTDEQLDENIDQLNPRQLNRLVTSLTSDVPLYIDKEGQAEFIPADDSILKRLVGTSKGELIQENIDQNIDARQLLENPETTIADLPEYLQKRLKEPQWSAPVLANIIERTVTKSSEDETKVDVETINKILPHYEQLLSKEKQLQVAELAGEKLASVEGLALGNILANRFKGLLGENLYNQILYQLSDEKLDESIDQLNPKQINRLVTALTHDVPLFINKEGEAEFIQADDSVLKRLIGTNKGPEVKQALELSKDTRQLLENPQTTLAELPENLLQRIKEPKWSAPLLANVIEQVINPESGQNRHTDSSTVNKLLPQYEQILDKESQTQVVEIAGARLASMEGLALGNVIAHKFKGLLGEQLYDQIIGNISDQQLNHTVDVLDQHQLNRLVSTITANVVPTTGDDHSLSDSTIVKRLAQTRKGTEIKKSIALNLDANILQAEGEPGTKLSDKLLNRLQQPAWSAPVLVTGLQQVAAPTEVSAQGPDQSRLDRMLNHYDRLLSKDKQTQVAAQAGSNLASMEEQDLGLLLVHRFKGLFGEKLYGQVINQVSNEKFEKLAKQMEALASGIGESPVDLDDKELQEAYVRLMKTVRGEKMRAILDLHKKRKGEVAEQSKTLIEKGLDLLLDGKQEALKEKQVADAMPQFIIDFIEEGHEDQADSLLIQLALALQNTIPSIRNNAIVALANTAEKLPQKGQWLRLAKLIPAIKQGFKKYDSDEEAIESGLSAFTKLADHCLQNGQFTRVQEVVQSLGSMSTAPVETGIHGPLQRLAHQALEEISTQKNLEKLMEIFLRSEEHQEEAGRILSSLGRASAKLQLNTLMKSDSRFDRKRLLNLIKQTGRPAREILLDQLGKISPWYVTRNIIRLLGEIGNPVIFSSITPYITHNDLRVQQEVLSTAPKIGGEALSAFMIKALRSVADPLKIKVVNQMGQLAGLEYVRPLMNMLEGKTQYQGRNLPEMQTAMCRALGKIGSRRATTLLNRISQSKKMLGMTGYSEEVRTAAKVALQQIRITATSDPEEKNLAGPATTDYISMEKQQVKGHHEEVVSRVDPVAEEEERIFALAGNAQPEEAKEALFDLITSTARSGDFNTAERLRERIYEIDPNALTEIIRSGEIIEEEKQGAVKDDDLEIWSDLMDKLTSEEFHTIYHELRERSFKPEETIVRQGDKNDELFFISQGSVKVSHMIGNKEIFVTSLNRGQIAGESFFSPSVWTVSLTSLTPSRISILKNNHLKEWREKFPGLDRKLQEFYNKSNDINAMLDKKGLNRRQNERFKVSRKIQVQPIDNTGRPIGKGFRADLADISQGGTAFVVRITKKDNARLLLGRAMQVVLPIGGQANFLYLKGMVIGVQPFNMLDNDHSVHFNFNQRLSQEDLQLILG